MERRLSLMLTEIQIAKAAVPIHGELRPSGNRDKALFWLGRSLTALALAALLLTSLMTWIGELDRVSRLEAEPTPPFKVITKHQAWQRIYSRQPQ
jgi:hypothetical protein